MRIDILTLFPEMFGPVLEASILGRAQAGGHADYRLHNIRDHADNKHAKVDDRPFGGGPGMVMMCQPLHDCVLAVEEEEKTPATRILLTPQGKPLKQEQVEELAKMPRLLLIAGHYEGVDERVIEELAPLEISVGDYVLSGGELPAMVLIDAVVRLIPGVLGHEDSAAQDSFAPGSGEIPREARPSSAGKIEGGESPAAPDEAGCQTSGGGGGRVLDCPHYTRPRVWNDRAVPEVLLSGDHGAVEKWRRQQMIDRTRARRPDLLQ